MVWFEVVYCELRPVRGCSSVVRCAVSLVCRVHGAFARVSLVFRLDALRMYRLVGRRPMLGASVC